ncbi:Ubiquitin-conjugating enzyme E2 6 [Lobulomyces angularis]|nr:Ubiquitin-conjugating enzyme E2 6 [Lobulomyces angularis]
MASKQAYKRLTKEYLQLHNDPIPFIVAKPLESNILEWHYIITGPKDSPYSDGQYHGVIIFPGDYPYKPPAIKMLTPNGRFQVNFRLCLTMSDYHPGSWKPAWSVSTILNGLLSFMLEDTSTTGSIITTKSQKILFAKQSRAWNSRNQKFREIFPEYCLLEEENSLETSNNEIQNEDRTISAIHDGNLVNRKAQIKLKKDYNTEVNNIRQGTSSSKTDKSFLFSIKNMLIFSFLGFCYLFIVKVSERIV